MIQGDPSKASERMGSSVYLIGVALGARRNVMAATRVMFVSANPPLLVAAIHPNRYSHDMIKEAGEFVVSVVSPAQVELAAKVGSTSGRDGDKFANLGIETVPATKISAPLLVGAAANMECKVVDALAMGDRTLFVGEIVALHVDEDTRPVQRLQGKYYELGAEVY